MSKGSASRIKNVAAYKDNFESIFGKKDPILKEPFQSDLLREPGKSPGSAIIDIHMALVEKFRTAGGSVEHHYLLQKVRESAWDLYTHVDCK